MYHTAQACKIDKASRTTDQWYVSGEDNCHAIQNVLEDTSDILPDRIVFTVLIPHRGLDMSRWHQFMVGVVSFDVEVKDKPRKVLFEH